MPRVIVIAEKGGAGKPPVLMDEYVIPDHLESEHSSLALIERLAWAVHDAAAAEGRFSQMFGPRPAVP